MLLSTRAPAPGVQSPAVVSPFSGGVHYLRSDGAPLGKRKRRTSNRVKRLVAKGGTPFTCSDCPRVFASPRDLEHHRSDAHFKKVFAAMTHKPPHQHQRQNRLSFASHANVNVIDTTPPPLEKQGTPFTRLFSGGKHNKDEILVIDFVTPHPGRQCEEAGCDRAAIPLTDFCEQHDPLLAMMLEAKLAAAKPKVIILPPRQPTLIVPTNTSEGGGVAEDYDADADWDVMAQAYGFRPDRNSLCN